jgi:hypothetical protein
MPKESTIQHYTSSTTGNTPAAVDLATGELAINTADERIFLKNINGSVLYLSQTKDLSGAFAGLSKVVSSVNGTTGAVQITGSGAILQTVSGTTTTFGARLASTSATGVASFNNTHFTVDGTGHVKLAAPYQVTGDTVITVAGSGIGLVTSGRTDTLYNIGVTSFNGLTGTVSLTGDGAAVQGKDNNRVTARFASTSLTGVASFNNVHFTVDTTGHVKLGSAYQATGDTVQAGSFINIGAGKTINNIGVQTFNGLTGAITYSVPLATNSLTGTASFNPSRFTVSLTGNVDLVAAFQATGDTVIQGTNIVVVTNGKSKTVSAAFPVASASVTGVASFDGLIFNVDAQGKVGLNASFSVTGDTVITVAGSGIGLVTSGRTDTLYNIGVTSFNGLTGNISLTGDGGSSLVLGNTVVTNRLATTAATGVASFNNVHFTVDTTGHVKLGSAYQVTGQTVVSGGSSQLISTSGNTVTIDNRVATSSVTGVASFNATRFSVSAAGAVDLAASYQVTGQTIVAGNNISTTTSGNTVTINVTAAGANTYVQFNSNGSLSADDGLQFDSSTETLRIGSAVRHLELTPGVDNFVQAFGGSNLRLVQAAGNPITIGDFDGNYGGNNTYIQVDDVNSNIYMNAASMSLDSAVSIGFGLSASSLYVSSGATFNSNLDVNGNATLGNAATDTTTIYGTKIVNEGVYANGSLRTANISFANGQVQTLTGVGTGATGATAIYFTNPPSSGAASVTMIITNGGLMTGTGMTAWGGNIKWAGGIKPVLTSSGVDVVSFVTPDAGTTIYGFVGGLGFS